MKQEFTLLLVMLTLSGLGGGCSSMNNIRSIPKSDHFNGDVFYNPWGANNSKGLMDVIKWKISSVPLPWPTPPIENIAKPLLVENGRAASVHITSIGHATIYIQDEKINILTDPQFSHRASPVSLAGPSRFRKPAIEISQLPGVDIVVISHNHYDHLDLPTLVELNKKFHPRFIVPLGNKKILVDQGIENVTELDWWEQDGNIQLVPAQHWSARGLWDKNKALWGGYIIEISGKKIFFAGDTGYGPHFKMIREKCGPMDLALLPIGAYEPRWFMKDQHMNPEDAVLAHRDLEAKTSFAMHFETFRLTDEAFNEPRIQLIEALKKHNIDVNNFFVPHVGETLVIKN